ncbi:hypothetical protein PCASD_04296 [Puccinia coronata f. sp. avenae]|uniref:Uncharacterized protein n=1 Tax=Puccinia coronata f. sp. avenae TaxID=200324 RepID=A0A2N5VCW2_9BASI|nr:hypothetical protein PCASD_04296 [Puccinia coronata f. sp. avenae]
MLMRWKSLQTVEREPEDKGIQRVFQNRLGRPRPAWLAKPNPGQTWASAGWANNEWFSVWTHPKPGKGLGCPQAAQAHLQPEACTAGINRSNTAVRAVLKQPCSTGGRTGTVRPKHLPAGRTGLSDQFLGPVAQDQPGPVGQICPTSWLSLWSDSLRLTTGRTRLFEHRSSSRN